MHYKSLLQSQLGRNIFTNYLTVFWMGGLSILLIPFYLKILGPEQWGIVAICMTLQAFFNLLDAGLAQIMPRDVARVAHDPSARLKVFSVYQRSYLGLALGGFIFGQLIVGWLIEHWFSSGKLFYPEDNWAFHLVILQFLFQFSNNANIGYWNGMQMQGLANLRQCFFGSIKHLGALSLVFFWHADAFAYLVPFALISCIELIANRQTIVNSFKTVRVDKVHWADYKVLGREAGTLFLGVLIGMLSSQLDRIVLSKYVDVQSFGIYVIVANLGLAVMQLQHPLVRAFLPRITQEHSQNTKNSFKQLAIGILFLCILPCIVLAFLSPWILKIWIGEPNVMNQGSLPLSLFFCAVAINAIYQLVYQQVLISNDSKWIVKTNFIVLLIISPLLFYIAPIIGIVSGAIYWLSMSILQLILGLIWLRQRSVAKS
jgi:hypothetical protein